MNSNEDSLTMSQISSPQKDYCEAFKKCSVLNNSLKTRCEGLEETLAQLKESNMSKDEEIDNHIQLRAELERKHTNTRQHVSNLQAKLTYLDGDVQLCKELKTKVCVLQREVSTLKSLKTILEGTAEDCEDVLRNTTDAQTMGMLVTGLKRDYNALRKSKSELSQHSQSLQKQLNYSRLASQKLQEELTELRLEKNQIESDLSLAERKHDSLCRKMGEFEDKSYTNSPGAFHLNVSKGSPLSKAAESTPLQLKKRPRTEHSVPASPDHYHSAPASPDNYHSAPASPDLFGDTSMDSLTKEFQAELSKDDDLEELAVALNIPLSMAAYSPRSQMKNVKQDNLFTKTGFDGLGGSMRVRKELAPIQKKSYKSMFGKNKHKVPSSLARAATLGNFFKKI